MVRSADGGKSWSDAVTIIDTPMDDRDNSIAVLPDGSLYTTYHASIAFAERTGPRYDPYKEYADTISEQVRAKYKGFWAARSTDNGSTWDEPVKIPAMTPHGPTVLADGRLIMIGGGNVFHSADSGITWEQAGTIPHNTETWKSRYAFMSEPACVQASDGRIIALARYRDGSDIDLRQTVSVDGGKTWSEPVQTGMRGYPAHILKLSNGWLLASYGRRIAPMGQRACISKDNGETWLAEDEVILSNAAPQGAGDLGYPATAQLADGSLWTVYYQVEKQEHGEYPSLMATHWRLRGQ
ncbi:MAG: sialidase family protein [Phycisphaerales bacterium]